MATVAVFYIFLSSVEYQQNLEHFRHAEKIALATYYTSKFGPILAVDNTKPYLICRLFLGINRVKFCNKGLLTTQKFCNIENGA